MSTINYNPTTAFGTVHSFSYGCITQNPEFMGTFDNAHERGTCLHNYLLSLILIAFIACGVFLTIKSKTL